ncbi:pyrroline-5-carboxylate reductase 2-like [Parasteatoda tepidariorum]|uniref:pyrroline-5-carboxylate reductase 2-like n=1 Tax=Parasteatoda tepidariorum TaxID=114398 RepID=UPI00077F95F2
MKIGVIGAGNIGQALVRGILASGFASPEEIWLSRRNTSLLDDFKEKGCHITTENAEVVQNSEIILVGVKPHHVWSVLREVKEHVTADHLIISAAMGVTTTKMEEILPPMSRVIRCTPNTAAVVLAGVTVFSCGKHTRKGDAELARKIFSGIGFTEEAEEKLMDAVTGVSGAGPAFVLMAIEAIADGGVKMGLLKSVALKLAAHTVLGAAKMVIETGQHPGLLKDQVISPGGATIRGIHELEKNCFRGSLMTAVEVATLRSKETEEEANKSV